MARDAGQAQSDDVRVVGAVRVMRRGRDWSDPRLGALGLHLLERIDVAGTAAHGPAPTLRVGRARGAGFFAVVVQRDDGVEVIGLDRDGDEWAVRLPQIPLGLQVTLYVVELAESADLQAVRDAVTHRETTARPPRTGVLIDDAGDVVRGGGQFDDGGFLNAEAFPEFLPEPPAPPRPRAAPAPPRRPRPRRSRAAPGRPPTPAHVDAEMPARLVQRRETTLTVRLSREQLEPTPGAAHADTVIPVDENLPVQITVLPRGLRFVPGVRATRTVRLPAAGADAARLTFRLMPVDIGRGEVSVVVRQAPVQLPLATLRLSAPIVAFEDIDAVPGDAEPRRAADGFVDRSTELAELPTIRIDESLAGGCSTLRVAVSVKGQYAEHPVTIGNKAVFIERLYRRLGGIREQVESAPPVERRQLAERLVAETGRELSKALFKGKVAALLWRHRKALTGVIVQTSAELDLPWEIMHLRPPEGQAGDGASYFLAGMGLTRWIYDTAHPTEIRIRPGRVHAVAPEYQDPVLQLPRAANEVKALTAHVRTTPTPFGGPHDFSAVVASKFDLLHFAGHGRWHDVDPRGQQLVLAAFAPDADDGSAAYSDADARADFPEPTQIAADADGPLVFLSACDVGRLRSGAAGLGGFAEVFLRGGAGAFIGCNWAVRDDVASHFVTSFYAAAFTPGTTIGEAALVARRTALRAGDLSALAFTVFANPRARLVTT